MPFYRDVLGFEEIYRRPGAVFMSAGGYHHHIALNTWESRGGQPPAPGTFGLYHIAILYLTRRSAGRCAAAPDRRRHPARWRAADHGVSEALYLRDESTTTASSFTGTARAKRPQGRPMAASG